MKSRRIALVILITLFPLKGSMQVPGQEFFRDRRERFMQAMDGGIAVFPGRVAQQDGLVNENQAKYCYYLSGCDVDGAWLVLDPDGRYPSILVMPPPLRMISPSWTGEMPGFEEVKTMYAVDTVVSSRDLDGLLDRLCRGTGKLWINLSNEWLYHKMADHYPPGGDFNILNAQPIIDEMRVIKDRHETDMTREASRITCLAHIEAMKFTRPGSWENEIEAVIEYTFRSNGAEAPGFGSIIGSGPRSTVLHYDKNNQPTRDGDVMVMDIGAMVNHYTADVTRTIPVNGRFSSDQLIIYNLVLKAQEAAIREFYPGNGLEMGHHTATRIIMEGLYELGLVTDTASGWQRDLYILYENSHYVGLNIHDVGEYQRDRYEGRKLEPGMVITIEPGIYFHPDMLDNLENQFGMRVEAEALLAFREKVCPAFERFRNIGVRIEDILLITEDGHDNLSKAAPKEPQEIEALMKKKSCFRKK
jgi:Xaa-Pro aminopeptidase